MVPLTPLLPLSAGKQGQKVWLCARRRALLGAEVSSIPAHVTLQVIQPLELFRGLEHEALTAIAQRGRWRSVTRATFFFFQGDSATAFYVLRQGRALPGRPAAAIDAGGRGGKCEWQRQAR